MFRANQGEGCASLCQFRARKSVRGLILVVSAILGVLLGGLRLSPAWQESGAVSSEQTARVQALVDGVKSTDPRVLARALGVQLLSQSENPPSEEGFLMDLGGLSGKEIPQLALKWSATPGAPPGTNAPEETTSAWRLFLLSWDGQRWVASGMMSGHEPFTVRALPVLSGGGTLIAVVIFSPADAVPSPVVFLAKAHHASLAWDSRADESRYEGYRGGRVQFGVEKGTLEMVETGRADPGLLVFSGRGPRGFDARTVYVWEGGAFVPRRTEYSQNPDFVLYRFISALHLHDFRTAYGLVNARKFLQTDQASLKLFRQRMEDAWPEFLDDRIFEARDAGPADYAFTLHLRDRVYVYTPAFEADAPWLLTGLQRAEQEPESE